MSASARRSGPRRAVLAGVAVALTVAMEGRSAFADDKPPTPEVTPPPPAPAAAPPRRWDFGGLPLVTYAPETSLAVGGVIVLFDDAPAPSSGPRRDDQVSLFLGATLRKQFIGQAEGLKYFKQGRYRLTVDVAALRFPNFFWGVGNDTPDSAKDLYTQELFASHPTFSVRVVEEVYVGAVLQVGWYRATHAAPGGAVAAYTTSHTRGGSLTGAGIQVRRDTRDDAMGPRTGSLTTFVAGVSDRWMGSGYSYQLYDLDHRSYLPLGKRVVLALQAYGHYVPGSDVPLDELSALGGGSRLRGYFEGRFRDHLYLVGQAEGRVHLFSRFSVAPFAAVGNVFPDLKSLSTARTKVAGGVGLRFSIKKERDLNIRLDVAKSPISSGLYINLGEAF